MRTLVTSALVTLTLSAPTLQAGSENVTWPGDYRATFSQYYSGDRVGNDKQMIRIFANEAAVAGKQADGKLPYGSVVVGELYSVQMGADGAPLISGLKRRIPDKLAAIVVMQRGEGFDTDYPEALKVGDWEFAVFSPDGTKLDKDVTACRSCHHPLADKEFLFSYEHLGH